MHNRGDTNGSATSLHAPRRHHLELLGTLSDPVRQGLVVGVAGPAFERDLEDCDPGLGRRARWEVGDPTAS
jgi:hypothetical protein